MDKTETVVGAFNTARTATGSSEIGAKIVMALAIGWGLAQVAKGLLDIGEGAKDIASAARLGYFQS